MAKNRNTTEKRRREVDKKDKANIKLARRRRRQDDKDAPEIQPPAIPEDVEDEQ